MRRPIAFAILAAGLLSEGRPAGAAEYATSFYLLGTKMAMAGFVPPPGTYVSDINFYYSGEASGAAAVGAALRRLGNVTVEADVELRANAYVNAPIATWIAPEKVLGGNVGFGVMVPFGWKDVNVDLDVRH